MKYNGYSNLTLVKYDCKKYEEVQRCSYANYKNPDGEDKNFYDTNIEFKNYKYKESKTDTKIEKNTNAREVQREFNILQNELKYINLLNSSNALSGLARADNFFPSKYKRDSSKVKILAVSDSYGEGVGHYNPYKGSWPGQIEDILLRDGYNIEVDRFASNGADFPDYLEMLSSDNIKVINPDIIVISLFMNDLSLPHYKADYHYVRCIKKGVGGEVINSLFREYIPFIYSRILSANCDMQRLKVKYGDDVITDGYLKLEDAPFSELYKESMNKILANANGRPVVIQPLFSSDIDYSYIKDYIRYLKSIGYIIPDYNFKDIIDEGKVYSEKIPIILPADSHFSSFWINKLVKPTIITLKNIISEKYTNYLGYDLSVSSSVIKSVPRTLKEKDLYLQYERSSEPKVLYVSKFERDTMSTEVGSYLDDVLCTAIDRAHVRIYLNQLKHRDDNFTFNLLSSESPVVIAGIYLDENGSESYTELSVVRPKDTISFSKDDKITGLIIGSPVSGCSIDTFWSMPSFLAKLNYSK
jgi:lysophospholipase L1-like esterase